MRARWAFLVLVVTALLLSACGGGGGGAGPEVVNGNEEQVPENAIALVAGTPILRTEFDRFFRQAAAAFEAQGRDFPATGTPEYEALKLQTVDLLVARIEFTKEAELLGVSVTDADVATRLQELKDQFYAGDEAKFREELQKVGITEADVEADVRANLLNKKIFDEVTKGVAVADEEVDTYYAENEARFTNPDTREVAHILVATKEEADEIRAQLEEGGDFAKLAEEKSTDTVSAADGGKLTARKDGSFVEPFETEAFALETGAISKPVETEFGWHLIKALGDVVPAGVTPLDEVREAISDQLRQEKQNELMADWVTEARAKYAGQVAYRVGFAPASSSSTTGTGTTP